METLTRRKRIEKNILNIAVYTVAIACCTFVLPKMLRFFASFVIGILIAMIANPLVRFLEKKVRIRRKHSSVVIIIGVLALVIIGGYNLLALLFHQAFEFTRSLPGRLEVIQQELHQLEGAVDAFLQSLPIPLENPLQGSGGGLGDFVNSLIDQITTPAVSAAGSVAKGLPNALVYTIVVTLSAYFFLADREKMAQWFADHLPGPVMRVCNMLQKSGRRIVGGYFSAQAKIMLVVMIELLIGFFIIGEDYALLLAFLIALLDFLPVFGTGTILLPWALYHLLTGNLPKALALGVIYLVSQVIHQGIQPKMVGDSMGLNPLYTLFLLFIGFRMYGLGGMIMAVPVGLILLEFYNNGYFNSLFSSLRELWRDIDDLRKGLPDRMLAAPAGTDDAEGE